MISIDEYYIVPAEIADMYKDYNDGNMYANFVRLNDGRYAINERCEVQFPEEFEKVKLYMEENHIPSEKRKIDYSEIWVDPDLPPIPTEQ
jgi:hypothetical protein